MDYYKKYCKYKQKYLKMSHDIQGGDIDENDILNLIESIGYEFESAHIAAYINTEWNNSNEDVNPLYTDTLLDGKYYDGYNEKTLFLINEIKLYTESNDKHNLDVSLKAETLSSTVKDLPHIYSILNTIDKQINDIYSYNLLPVIYLITEDEKIINFSNENIKWAGDELNLRKKHCEYIFTFTKLQKSNNIIKKKFNVE